MPESWTNYWYFSKVGKLVKTERLPKNSDLFVYETAERPSTQISRHTFFCPATGETQKFDALDDRERLTKRAEIARGMLKKAK